jgi:hypothetical protein
MNPSLFFLKQCWNVLDDTPCRHWTENCRITSPVRRGIETREATKDSELLKDFAGALNGFERMAFSESFDTGEAANAAAMVINYSLTLHGSTHYRQAEFQSSKSL